MEGYAVAKSLIAIFRRYLLLYLGNAQKIADNWNFPFTKKYRPPIHPMSSPQDEVFVTPTHS